jgi:4'-phosphopantetheinyl transferase
VAFPGLALDPARPLRLWHGPDSLTIAIVSIAWLRALADTTRRDLVHRHLDAADAARNATLRTAKRQHEWLAGRLSIKHSIAAHMLRTAGTSLTPREIRVGAIGTGIRSGQLLAGVPATVSLSHSADFAVAACGSGPVGVDVELVRAIAPPLAELLRADDQRVHDGRVHDGRGAADGTGGLRDMPLSLRWSCKEAVLKCYGVGLRVDARQVQLVSWRADGEFGWTPGPELLRLLPAADPARLRSWARPLNGYSLALTWTPL